MMIRLKLLTLLLSSKNAPLLIILIIIVETKNVYKNKSECEQF